MLSNMGRDFQKEQILWLKNQIKNRPNPGNTDILGVCHYDNMDLSCAILVGAELESVSLRKSKLNNAYLIAANVKKANLEDADLSNSHLQYADFREANLKGANLEGAIIINADFYGTIYNNETKWPDSVNPQLLFAINQSEIDSYSSTIIKEFHMSKTDEAFSIGGEKTIIQIRKASPKETSEREYFRKKAWIEMNDNINFFVEEAQTSSAIPFIESYKESMAYFDLNLVLVSSNMELQDGKIFNFTKRDGVFRMDMDKVNFGKYWKLFPDLVKDEIYECIYKMNENWQNLFSF